MFIEFTEQHFRKGREWFYMVVDFFERKKSEFGVSLNSVQKEAVEHTEGPLLVLASPGSGKTTTLNMKIGYLIEVKNIDPTKIMAVTFSKASASDMRVRFAKFFPHVPSDSVHFSTIHSFSFQVVREYFRKKKINYQLVEGDKDPSDTEKGEVGQQRLYKKTILRRLFQDIVGEQITEDQMDELMTYISYIKNKLIRLDELKDVKTDVPSAADIYKAYEEFKNQDPQNLLLDYDDMLTIANSAMEEDADLLQKYQRKFVYILTDESQDTSLVQHEIIEKLVREHRNICVVGDIDQTIYRWRGAEPSALLNFEKVYPGATILSMGQNYRSSKDIVYVANQFIKRNKDRYDKDMFTENGHHMPISIKDTGTYEAQIKYVVSEIATMERKSDAAVLYRNNSASIPLINELDYAGIPFYIKDTDNKFFSHWLVEDILNFMRLSYSDKRIDIFEKIHTKCIGYISKYHIEYLKGMANNESMFDNLLKRNDLKIYQIKQIRQCKELFAKMNKLKPRAAIQMIRDDLGYEKAIVKMCERYGFKKEVLVGMLNTLERIANKLDNLKDFSDRLKHLENLLRSSKYKKEDEVDCVTLSTFHSSKGLEFPRVFMIDLIDGVIPSTDAIKDFKDGKRDEMEEAARLFYVGMTRPEQQLELLTYKRKGSETVKESIFVQDVRRILFPNMSKVENKGKKEPIVQKKAQRASVAINPNAYKSEKDIVVGDKVKHASFGIGYVTSLDSQMIGIRFENGIGLKKLAVTVLIERGLLEPAPILAS